MNKKTKKEYWLKVKLDVDEFERAAKRVSDCFGELALALDDARNAKMVAVLEGPKGRRKVTETLDVDRLLILPLIDKLRKEKNNE